MMPSVIAMLREFGFQFGLDWDGELQIKIPKALDPRAIAEWLGKNHQNGIKCELLCRAQWARSQCVGGPFNGRRHGKCYPSVFAIKVKPGEWAAYAVHLDSRAMFAGIGSSEKKARQLAWKKQVAVRRLRSPDTQDGGAAP